MSINKRTRHLAVYLFSVSIMIAWVVTQAPGFSPVAANTSKQPKASKAVPATSMFIGTQGAAGLTKEQSTARLNELDLEIESLRGQLGSNPKNITLLNQLNNTLREYNTLSASMGGDQASPRGAAPSVPGPGPKDALHDQMRSLETTIENLRRQLSADPNNLGLQSQLNDALGQLKSISASLGGDLPVHGDASRPHGGASVPPGCTPTTTTVAQSTPVAIPTGPAVVTSTLVVAGAGTYLFDVNALTNITHTFAADLDVTITSPAGTVVTLTTDNGAGNDNVFNGTLWDDDANPAGQVPYTTNNGLVTDHAYVNLTLASPLVPEEAMAAFIGENPNGTWTITISDDLAGDGGSLDSWSLALTTIPAAPTEATASTTQSTPVAIPTGPAVVTSTLVVAGAGQFVTKATLLTNLTHTFAADLDITITSPAGTVVTLTTDNGAGNDNVFNGTLWDDDANPAGQVPYTTNNGVVSDHAYVNLTTATPLVPEEAMGAFIGEDPNGTWTITISDDLAGDGGSLDSWTLNITTGTCGGGSGPCMCTSQTVAQSTPVAIPTGPAVVTSTLVVAGAGTYLYDANLTTFLTHTFAADLDVTITSPAGTVVTLTTDNGAGNDNVFNGTLWDDDANPAGQVPYVTNNGLVTDHAYVNLTLASPLVPEEAMAAFIGENPNGTWTITISDDLAGDGGSLNSWSLDLCTLPSPPQVVATQFTQSTPVAIPTGPAVVTSTLVASGLGTQTGKVTLLTNLTHTFAADLDITITSPAGTVVTLTTDNGAGNDNVFNGTLWDDDANPAGQVPYTTNNGVVSDHAYVNLTTATPLVPEEAMGAFIGEDPNGTWTITISDDLAGDGGSLNSWTLEITTTTCGAAVPCVVTCPANVTQSNDPNQCGAVVNYPAPTTTGPCTTVTCTPPSGSFFPVGTTTVTCADAGAPRPASPGGCMTQTISHSSSQAITPLNSVSCNNGVGHTDNSYWRAFSLPAFSIAGGFDVQSVDIGIEDAISGAVAAPTKGGQPAAGAPVKGAPAAGGNPKTISKNVRKAARPAGGGQMITVRIHQSATGTFPTGTRTLLNSVTVNVPDQSGTILNVPITGTVTAGGELIVEVFTPNGEAAGNLFFIGSNAAAETGPSYLSAADCGVTSPTTTTALGFPDMHIVMNVNGCPSGGGGGGTGPSCTFTVTVNDTQPPTITCPANVTAVTPICGGTTTTVTFPPPTASDNCPGVVVACVPPSGSILPIGVTTVTCTATDAAGNTATCSFTVTVFNACLQDDNNPNTVILWNTSTGDYRFCCNGTIYIGVGTVIKNKGNSYSLSHTAADRRVNAVLDCALSRGQAGLQSVAGTLICTISDRDTRNNTCNCGGAPPPVSSK